MLWGFKFTYLNILHWDMYRYQWSASQFLMTRINRQHMCIKFSCWVVKIGSKIQCMLKSASSYEASFPTVTFERFWKIKWEEMSTENHPHCGHNQVSLLEMYVFIWMGQCLDCLWSVKRGTCHLILYEVWWCGMFW